MTNRHSVHMRWLFFFFPGGRVSSCLSGAGCARCVRREGTLEGITGFYNMVLGSISFARHTPSDILNAGSCAQSEALPFSSLAQQTHPSQMDRKGPRAAMVARGGGSTHFQPGIYILITC